MDHLIKNWEKIPQDCEANFDLLKITTKPIREQFGVELFNYHRINQDGRVIAIGNRPDWAYRYIDAGHWKNQVFLKNFDQFETSITYLDGNGKQASIAELLQDAKNSAHIHHGVLSIERKKTYTDFFGFYSGEDSSKFFNLVINKPKLMKCYQDFFKKKLDCIFT